MTCNTTWSRKRKVVIKRDGNNCIYCFKLLTVDLPKNHPDRVTLDHIVPQSEGGSDLITNLTIACGECNSKRGSMNFFSYLSLFTSEKSLFEKYNNLLLLGENLACAIFTHYNLNHANRIVRIREESAVALLNRSADYLKVKNRLDYEDLAIKLSDGGYQEVLPFKDLCYLIWKITMDIRTVAENMRLQ